MIDPVFELSVRLELALPRGRDGLDCGCMCCACRSRTGSSPMDVAVTLAALSCSVFTYLSLDLLIRQFQVSRAYLEKTPGG